MIRSKIFVAILLIAVIAIGTLFFFSPQEDKEKSTIRNKTMQVNDNLDPDDENSGIVKDNRKEIWTVRNEHKLEINTFDDFKKKSDLVIPAKFDGKDIYSFEISFYNDDVTTLKNVTIEEGVRKIGYGLVQCSKLEKVYIPSTVKKIVRRQFYYSRKTVTLYVEKGSYAEKYAKKNKLKYEYYDGKVS